MSLTQKQLDAIVNNHAANGVDKGRTYGSIDAGIKVMSYRSERVAHHLESGLSFVDAKARAEEDVINKFGEPAPA